MNRCIILLLSLLLSSSLKSSQECYKLQRTYSTNPAADKLKSALVRGDLEKVKELIGRLPKGIDYQYVYLALASTSEVCTFFLESMLRDWLERIQEAPHSVLSSLLGGLTRLSRSYELCMLDHGFRVMLVKLKKAVSTMPCVLADVNLAKCVQQIPDYDFDENTLQIQSAYIAALQGSLDNICEDLLVLMAKARHNTDVAYPLNSMDTSE